jgi:hypothetical protein
MKTTFSLEWFQSAIIRQQIVAFLVALLTLIGVTTDVDIDATVGAIMAGVAALIPLYTIATRLFKPTPPITETAVAATVARDTRLEKEQRK